MRRKFKLENWKEAGTTPWTEDTDFIEIMSWVLDIL